MHHLEKEQSQTATNIDIHENDEVSLLDLREEDQTFSHINIVTES